MADFEVASASVSLKRRLSSGSLEIESKTIKTEDVESTSPVGELSRVPFSNGAVESQTSGLNDQVKEESDAEAKRVVLNAPDFVQLSAEHNPNVIPINDIEHALVVPKRAPQLLFYGKKTGIAYDVRMRYHSRPIADPMSYVDPHPEDPRRTFRIYRAIAEAGLIEDETLQGSEHLGELMKKLPTRQATEEELRLVHTQQMIDFIKSTAGMQLEELQHEIDQGDSIYLNSDSNQAARLSAGGAIEACKAVVEGTVKNALAVIRPPGHHAEPGNAAGFCLFANVAIASQVMLSNYPETCRKILIYDWDVHHGNGTQRAFLDDNRVLYISTHRYDNATFYPGTRFAAPEVVGTGAGAGYSVNIAWPCGGMGDGDYITAFHKIIMPIASEFDPDLVIVSAGFDAAHGDPIGGCHVSPHGYQHMLSMLMTLAQGKVVVALEGGYNLDAISRSALAITKTLLGDPPGRLTSSLASNAALEVFAEVKSIHSKYWKSMGPPTIKFEPEIEAYNKQQHNLSERAEIAREQIPKEAPGKEGSGNEEKSNRLSNNETITDDSTNGSDKNGEGDKSDIAILRSLLDVVRGNEVTELSKKYEFAKLPMLRAPEIDSEVMSTPNIYNEEKVVIFFHGPSLIWAHRDPITGRIRPDESVVANPAMKYIKWSIKQGHGVVDVFLSPLESTTPAKLVSYICDNTVRFFKAKKIIILGAGQAYCYAVQMAAHRELRDRLTAIVCFVGPDDILRQFPSNSDDATNRKFHEKSVIFISKAHNTWKQKYTRKKCGRLVKANGENLYAVMREKFTETAEYILAEEEDDDDSSNDENNDDSSDSSQENENN